MSIWQKVTVIYAVVTVAVVALAARQDRTVQLYYKEVTP